MQWQRPLIILIRILILWVILGVMAHILHGDITYGFFQRSGFSWDVCIDDNCFRVCLIP